MPDEVALIGSRPLTPEDVLTAVAGLGPALDIRVVEAGGAVQVLQQGRPLITVVRPRTVASAAEARRLLPGRAVPDGGTVWWATVVIAPGADRRLADRLVGILGNACR